MIEVPLQDHRRAMNRPTVRYRVSLSMRHRDSGNVRIFKIMVFIY